MDLNRTVAQPRRRAVSPLQPQGHSNRSFACPLRLPFAPGLFFFIGC